MRRRSVVEAIYPEDVKCPATHASRKRMFLEHRLHFPSNHHVTSYETSFYHCTHFLFHQLGCEISLKDIKYKLMSLSFVLGKEVPRAHDASSSTLATIDDSSPSFLSLNWKKKNRKRQESWMNFLQFSTNSRETISWEETRAWALFVWKLFVAQAREN